MSGANLQSAPSFSVHSVAESSGAAISEAEEIHEVHKLLKSGEHAFKSKSFQHALRCYNEALEIDELSAESLAGRAAVYIELGNYQLAQKDAERVIAMDHENTQGHYLLGIAMHNLGYYRESLHSFLKALNLDADHNHVDVLTNNIATIASQIVTIPDKLLDKIPDMDPYKKLTEVGCCLYQGRKYDTCIKVLNSAQKLETNQKGITMKVQLTLANAHAALKHNELAVSLYQECLQTALSAHDASYETKSLVSIASLFLELGDTHQAIVNYQKLLDLQRELQGEDLGSPLPDYWSKDLQCALHLNLSIAFKTIGNMQSAVQHARIYCDLIDGHTPEKQKHAEARSHQNVGMLYEILGDYEKALSHYKEYLRISKEKGHQRGIAQAYGCLGSVYAQLRNRQLSITYHEQHVNIARSLADHSMLATALELAGDTYMMLEEYENAGEQYDEMYRSCPQMDFKMRTTSMCKLGRAFRHQKRYQYALFYFEQARDIAEDFDLVNVKVMCDYNVASMLQHSTQHTDLDKAYGMFSKLIPVLEGKYHQHQEENTFCPEQLVDQIQDCYNGIQNVLAKMGNGNVCLQYSEAQKKKYITQITQAHAASGISYTINNVALFDAWTVEKMTRAVNQQNATVLFYHLLPNQILMWVLKPGEGVVRFYAGKSYDATEDFVMKIRSLIAEIKGKRDLKHLSYECENRALFFKGDDLSRVRNENQTLSETYKRQEYRKELAKEIDDTEMSEKEKMKKQKPADRQLFDLLLAPVDDIIRKLEEGAPVVVIPDKTLYECPFAVLKDWDNKVLHSRVRVTMCPSLYALDKVIQNELNQLKLQDDLEFERTQARLGGIPKIMQNIDFLRLNMGSPDFICLPDGRLESRNSNVENLNLRQVSNPRLVTSGAFAAGSAEVTSGRRPKDGTLLSMKSKSSLNSLRDAPFSPRTRRQLAMGKGERTVTFVPSDLLSKNRTILTGAPTSLDKMISVHTMSTLTTRTSTNTDITQSNTIVTEFQQVSDPDKCVVIGAPKLPKVLLMHGKEWRPAGELTAAQSECYKVSDYCDVTAIVAEHATKDAFLQHMRTAAVLHIATIGCLKEGLLVFAPNPNRCEEGVPTMHSYVVTVQEIMQLKMVARLVVLSCGTGPPDRDYVDEGFVLPSAFLTAGAQCVVTMLWTLTNKALDKFFYHFYTGLQQGSYVTSALAEASRCLKKDDRYRCQGYWSPAVVIGKDVFLSIKFIRHAQLDQLIDEVEETTADKMETHPLNPRPLIPKRKDQLTFMTKAILYRLPSQTDEELLAAKEENLRVLQECMSSLLAHHAAEPNAIPQTTSLIDDAIKRLHVSDINQRTAILSSTVTQSKGAMQLVKFLGFHFQARGADLNEPYVIFPHWNHDELLIPAYEALRSIQDIAEKPTCARAVHELLPTTQDNISYLVDMLCITKHAPEIQLKVTDLSVRPLWKATRVRALLTQLGYQQIGTLLYFNNVQSSRKLLAAALQLLIALSVHKTSILLHKLDVNLLGGPTSQKGSSVSLEHMRLPTLTPILLPRNQLRMSTPWLSTAERSDEMTEKMKLSRTKSDVTSEYQFYLSKAKTWHQTSVGAQANESLDKYGRPRSSPHKVKVFPGATASQIRKRVDEEKRLHLTDSDSRRDYAHFIYRQRLDDVTLRHRNDIRKLYMPFTVNA